MFNSETEQRTTRWAVTSGHLCHSSMNSAPELELVVSVTFCQKQNTTQKYTRSSAIAETVHNVDVGAHSPSPTEKTYSNHFISWQTCQHC